MDKDRTITWSELRKLLKERNISETKFQQRLIRLDNGRSRKEILNLITYHVYHSIEEHLYAPPHLR